jgi:tRNA(adenine34) deaminase
MARAGKQLKDAPGSKAEDAARSRDEFWMGFALAEARAARDAGEVPIGAMKDPTAHAEILALREAARRVGNYRLIGATLYATIEPCAMCAGALVHARIKRLVYGAPDVRAGGVESIFAICTNSSLNHQVEVTSGIGADESRALMQTFFRARRKITA